MPFSGGFPSHSDYGKTGIFKIRSQVDQLWIK